jgi:hypothetical protein
MFNVYTVILSLFTVTGLLTTIWGWVIIHKGRKALRWPRAEGVIEQSERTSPSDDLLPHIQFSYTVAGKTYRKTLEFPKGITPTQEFSESYVKKFPAGSDVQVAYDPERPDHATLEPGPAGGDWLVFAFGLGMLIFGIVFLFFGW